MSGFEADQPRLPYADHLTEAINTTLALRESAIKQRLGDGAVSLGLQPDRLETRRQKALALFGLDAAAKAAKEQGRLAEEVAGKAADSFDGKSHTPYRFHSLNKQEGLTVVKILPGDTEYLSFPSDPSRGAISTVVTALGEYGIATVQNPLYHNRPSDEVAGITFDMTTRIERMASFLLETYNLADMPDEPS